MKDKTICCWNKTILRLAGEQNSLINRINGYLVIVKN